MDVPQIPSPLHVARVQEQLASLQAKIAESGSLPSYIPPGREAELTAKVRARFAQSLEIAG